MQKLVIEAERTVFSQKVNSFLADGWKVIAGTLTISPPRQNNDEYPFRYAVVLEKPGN